MRVGLSNFILHDANESETVLFSMKTYSNEKEITGKDSSSVDLCRADRLIKISSASERRNFASND